MRLRERLNNLFVEFARDGKMENRNEIVCILDFRQDSISEDEYSRYNEFLSRSLGSGVEIVENEVDNMEVDNDFNQLVQSTTDYIVKHDLEELEQLNDEYEDVELIKLIRDYLDEKIPAWDVIDYLENGQSLVPKSIQIRYKILVKDIESNRQRVVSILERIKNARENEIQLTNILESMRREDLISRDQYEKLLAIDEAALELETIASIIKDTKIGHGILLLPRARKDLAKLLTISKTLNVLDVCLNELLRMKAITLNQYRDIKNEM